MYLFANKCDLLTEVQDSFLAGARMEKTCRDSVGAYCNSRLLYAFRTERAGCPNQHSVAHK